MNPPGILQSILRMSSDYPLLDRLFLVSGELIFLALGVWLLIRLLRVRAPRVRALLWLLVLAKPILGLAVGTLLPLVQFSPPAVIEGMRIENSGPVDAEAMAARQLETRRALAALEDTSVSVTKGEEEGQRGGAIAARIPNVEEGSGAVFPVGSALIGLWIIGVVVFAGLALSDRVRIQRLLRATSPPGEDLARRFRGLAAEMGLKRTPRLRITDGLESPALVGLFQPIVLLPEVLAADSDPEQLDWLLRHELMHWKHHDPAGLAVRRAAEVLFFFHPVVWWAGRKWEEAMELACDRALLETETDARVYAQELYRVLENQHHSRRAPVAAGLFATRTQIGRRIEALLSNPLRLRARLTAFSVFGLLVVGVIGLTVGMGFSQDSEDKLTEPSDTISTAEAGGSGPAVIVVPPEEKPEPGETEDEMTPEEREEFENTIKQIETDLRNLRINLVSYYIDHSDYPEALWQLTTPIAYTSAVPEDPFAVFVSRETSVAGATEAERRRLPIKMRFAPDYTEIRLYSIGPDKIDQGGAVRYNPDDGPKGSGDIVRTIELDRYYRFEDSALQEKVDEQLVRLDSLKSAVNAWFIEHRDVPDTLEALAESLPHLESLFEDSFAPGRHASYRVDREEGSLTIWSMGPDGDDDGGEEVRGRFARGQVADGDLVVQLELEGLPGRFPEKSDVDLLLRDRPDERALYDMLVEIKEKEGRDNAMLHYILADGFMPDPPGERQKAIIREVLADGWSEKADQLLPYIAAFQPMFGEIRKGVALDYARNIGGEQGPASPVPSFLAAQVSAKMLCVEGRHFESQGKYEEALDNYLAVLTMGRDYASPNSVMIGHLISLAIQNTAFQQITQLASSGNLREETLGRALTSLRHIESTVNPIANALREEEKDLQWSINDMRRNPEKYRQEAEDEAKGWIDDVDQIEADNRDAWKFLIGYAETPEWEWRAKDFNRELEERREKYHPLVAIAMPNFVEAKTRFLVTRSRNLETQLATALAAYRVGHGEYPRSLDDLTPRYFERLPIDPFSGGKFRYETTGEEFRLWSVGPDGTDDHAEGPPDAALVYDPTNGTTSAGDILFR
jgi:beta-lactamase regulating signal transducer with metallopeptidase domain